MKIYVVRHGQTDWNVEHRLQGNSNIPLNTVGLEQAYTLAKKINELNIDMIISSPLYRALRTATIINEKANVSLSTDSALIERSFGTLEGVYGHQYNKNLYWDYDLNYTDNQVETIHDFFDRVHSFIDSLIKKYKDKNILLVTHNGVNSAINCYFNGLPKDKNLLSIQLDNCSFAEYNADKKRAIN